MKRTAYVSLADEFAGRIQGQMPIQADTVLGAIQLPPTIRPERRCAWPDDADDGIPSQMTKTLSLETSFDKLEGAAVATISSGAALQSLVKQLQKAAQVGDVGKIQKLLDRMLDASAHLRQDVSNTAASWELSDDELESYLGSGYEAELVECAHEAGLSIRRQDDRLVAYPSLFRVLPAAKAVEIDRKRNPMLRPSALVKILLANQLRKPSTKPEQFLETIFSAYKLLSSGGGTVTLAQVYDALTILPSARKEYSRQDFVRDLYTLDVSEVERTRSGAPYSLPASTGTKSAKNVFTFVSPSGEPIAYYGITFGPVSK